MKRATMNLFGIAVSAAVAFGVTNAASAVITFPYDPDGPGPIDSQIDINSPLPGLNFNPIEPLKSLNWSVGNAVSVGFVPVVGAQFTTFYQAKLAGFTDAGNQDHAIFGDAGPNTLHVVGAQFEWTAVAKFREVVTSVSGGTATFEPIDDPSNYLKIFFDGTPDANDLAGTGFGDGQLIFNASNPANGLGTFTTEANPPVLLDQSLADDHGGQLSVTGAGGFTVDAKADFVDTAFLNFPDPGAGLIRITFLNSSQKLPFQEVDPSRQFFDMALNGGLGGTFAPNLGRVNGLTGPDVQFQADANQSFDLRLDVPEPATAALGIMGLAGLALRRRRTA